MQKDASTMKRQLSIVAVVAILAVACGIAVGYLAWGRAKDWYAIAGVASLPKTPENDLVRYGWELIVDTPRLIGRSAVRTDMRFAGNNLACTQCHLNAGLKRFAAPLVSTYGSFPMMTNDHVLTLEERINGCMTRSMNGRPLPENGREMQAMIAYVRYLGTGTPESVRVEGMGLKALRPAASPPDSNRGLVVYQQTCARCHGTNGAGQLMTPPGVGFAIPPLWGADSFNADAGMGKLATAAAFVHANMPYLTDYRAPVLTEQQAWDVAAFLTSQPRPAGPSTASNR
jgi:thiosulfate dehydrogenase